jgi:hypothetical protein
MNDKEATVIYGAERFNNYARYLDSFKIMILVLFNLSLLRYMLINFVQHNQYQPYLINR